MTWILELVSKSGQVAFWFISYVVIPVTVWFTLLKADLSHVKERQEEDRAYIENVELKVDEKMDRIIQDLGVIKGELKRIK